MAVLLPSYRAVLEAMGERLRQLRLLRNVPQEELAERAGVGVKALRRFEASGSGTMETALRLATVLGVDEPFARLFVLPPLRSLDELDEQEAVTRRKRARRPR